jgi:glyoxylase-like metal-dependent hydrolase (beta-lactamase superfamily II)
MGKYSLEKIIVGPFEVNCYIFTVNNKTFIIDPGAEPKRIISLIKKNSLIPVQILLTHAHIDHISATKEVTAEFNIPVYLNERDKSLYLSPANSIMPFYLALKEYVPTVNTVSDNLIEAINTPGHTQGGTCFYIKEYNLLFSGDTIFQEAIGRTDLPGGSYNQLIESIKTKILSLPDNTFIYPGHGLETSVSREKRENPFL